MALGVTDALWEIEDIAKLAEWTDAMRITLFAASSLLLLLMTGCTTRLVTGYSSDAVTIRYDPILYSLEEVTEKAAEMCGRYGKTAKLTRDEPEAPLGLGFWYASFDCVE